MTVCLRCGEPMTFCRCWNFPEVAFAVALIIAGFATAARSWLDALRNF
jgi:hypothetical protein